MKETMMIAAGRLHPNPDNPRQGLGQHRGQGRALDAQP